MSDSEEVTFEQWSAGSDGGSHVDIWGREGVPGSRKSKCKGPGDRRCSR